MAIAGIISFQPSAADTGHRIALMGASLKHEQFQIGGQQHWTGLGIQAAWSAQPGSFAATQIFTNEQKDVQLILSGECFTTSTLRNELIRKGHQIGDAAGDWLVHQYEELGEKFFESLNGLFCGLLVDLRHGCAFLFNDRYGIERLYWHESAGALYFASEAKALLRALPELRRFDDEGVAQYLSYGCPVDGRTLYRGVQLAPGGALWRIEAGRCHRGRFFQPAEWEALPPLSGAEFQDRLTEVFSRILPPYFNAPGAAGISLTGGLDSRMIMAALPPTPIPPVCFTFTGESSRLLDSQVAARVARECGLRHETIPIGRDFFQQFPELADRTVYATDGCSGVLGAHEIYYNSHARHYSPVRVTGNFGSELLRNVSTFKPARLTTDLCSPDWAQVTSDCSPKRLRSDHPVRFAAFEEIPWSLFGTLCAARTQVTFRTPYLDNEIVALAFQAPQAVRTSAESAMRFIGTKNSRLADIPTDRGSGGADGLSRMVRRAIAEVAFKLDYYYSEGLPRRLAALDGPYGFGVRKIGFSGLHKFLHYRRWFQKELAPFARERLAAANLPFWNQGFVASMLDKHISGGSNFSREINAVVTLETVQRTMLHWSPSS